MPNGYCVHCGTAFSIGDHACGNCGVDRDVLDAVASGPPPKIPDYLIWSIITLCCCNMILGMVALVFSVLCRNDIDARRYEQAMEKSKIAFWCNVGAIALALLAIVVYIAIFGMFGAVAVLKH